MNSKNRNSLFIFLTSILLICLCSCIHESSESKFISMVGIDFQHYLDITILSGLPIKPNTVIDLYIKNKTADCVVFPYNFGVRLFVYKNNSWIEIPNNIIYASQKDVILDPREELNFDALVSLQPDYSKLGVMPNKYQMRVVMIGHLCKGGVSSNHNTGDYIELNIEQ
jgi:hypothetical protein